MTRLFALSAALWLAACSGTPETQTVAGTPGAVCKREVSTGSSIISTTCRSQAEIEYEREAAREAVNAVQRRASPAAKAPQ